jgi:hypothetical protein
MRAPRSTRDAARWSRAGVGAMGPGTSPQGNRFKTAPAPSAKPAPLFPDRGFLACDSPESGRAEVYVRSFPEGDQRLQLSTGGGQLPI